MTKNLYLYSIYLSLSLTLSHGAWSIVSFCYTRETYGKRVVVVVIVGEREREEGKTSSIFDIFGYFYIFFFFLFSFFSSFFIELNYPGWILKIFYLNGQIVIFPFLSLSLSTPVIFKIFRCFFFPQFILLLLSSLLLLNFFFLNILKINKMNKKIIYIVIQ